VVTIFSRSCAQFDALEHLQSQGAAHRDDVLLDVLEDLLQGGGPAGVSGLLRGLEDGVGHFQWGDVDGCVQVCEAAGAFGDRSLQAGHGQFHGAPFAGAGVLQGLLESCLGSGDGINRSGSLRLGCGQETGGFLRFLLDADQSLP